VQMENSAVWSICVCCDAGAEDVRLQLQVCCLSRVKQGAVEGLPVRSAWATTVTVKRLGCVQGLIPGGTDAALPSMLIQRGLWRLCDFMGLYYLQP